MKLYKRDYTKLTFEENEKWQQLLNSEVVNTLGSIKIRRSKYREYPVAARHFMSLFPNNHLDIVQLQNEDELKKLTEQFSETINDIHTTERTILNFINNNKAHFIIASLLKRYYSFGHHDAFVFPEFQIGNSFKADYLIVGKNSGGYEFVFVELEHPYKNTVMANGDLGEAFRKGLGQVVDWQTWLEENFTSLTETFDKYKHPEKMLPREFMKWDSSRFHYVVIAGRRKDYTDKTYKISRSYKNNRVSILHYDNLYDCARNIIGESTY